MKTYMVQVDDPILEWIYDDYLRENNTNVLPLEKVRG